MGIEFTYALKSFHALQKWRLMAGHAKILSLKYFGAMAFEYFEYLILVVLLEWINQKVISARNSLSVIAFRIYGLIILLLKLGFWLFGWATELIQLFLLLESWAILYNRKPVSLHAIDLHELFWYDLVSFLAQRVFRRPYEILVLHRFFNELYVSFLKKHFCLIWTLC